MIFMAFWQAACTQMTAMAVSSYSILGHFCLSRYVRVPACFSLRSIEEHGAGQQPRHYRRGRPAFSYVLKQLPHLPLPKRKRQKLRTMRTSSGASRSASCVSRVWILPASTPIRASCASSLLSKLPSASRVALHGRSRPSGHPDGGKEDEVDADLNVTLSRQWALRAPLMTICQALRVSRLSFGGSGPQAA